MAESAEKLAKRSGPGGFWDPFRGVQTPGPAHYSAPITGWPSSAKLRFWVGLACIGMAFAGKTMRDAGFTVPIVLLFGLVIGGFALLFLGVMQIPASNQRDAETRDVAAWREALAQVGGATGWGLRFLKPPVSVTVAKPKGLERPDLPTLRAGLDAAAKQAGFSCPVPEAQVAQLHSYPLRTDQSGATYLLHEADPFFLAQTAQAMLMPSANVPKPIIGDAALWWTHGNLPVWSLVSISDVLPASAVDRTRLVQSADGTALYAVIGFDLRRDTGVNADIVARILAITLKSHTTEAIEFNAIFATQLHEGSDVGLYQALTPAAQAWLIDEFRHSGAEVSLRGRTVFVRYATRLPDAATDNPDRSFCAQILQRQLSGWAEGLTRLKTFME